MRSDLYWYIMTFTGTQGLQSAEILGNIDLHERVGVNRGGSRLLERGSKFSEVILACTCVILQCAIEVTV